MLRHLTHAGEEEKKKKAEEMLSFFVHAAQRPPTPAMLTEGERNK